MPEENYITYLQNLSSFEREQEVNNKIGDVIRQILEDERVSSMFNELPGVDYSSWEVVDFKISEPNLEEDSCTVGLTFEIKGEQHEDSGYLADIINGEAEAVIDKEGNVIFRNIEPEIAFDRHEDNDYDDDIDPDDEPDDSPDDEPDNYSDDSPDNEPF